jgi:hypothetical protein
MPESDEGIQPPAPSLTACIIFGRFGMPMNKNKHRGSSFDDFLKEEGILEEVELKAAKRAVALQLEKLMKLPGRW